MALPAPRRLVAGEELAFSHAVLRGFHGDSTDESLRPWADQLRDAPDYRAWVVTDGDDIAGNLGVFATDLSLPGTAPLPVTAITAVGVAQTHRRRGLLRALMTSCLDEAEERSEPVAVLYASEAAIYTRFGFGLAAPTLKYRLDRVHTRFRDPVDPRLVEAVAPEAAATVFEPIFAVARQRRAGVGRTAMQWHWSFRHDPPGERDGASARRLVHVPGRGYAAYRVRAAWDEELPTGTVEVQDLVATDPEAETALWQHVCDIDLTATVEAALRPPDDALPRLLTDPMRTSSRASMPLYTAVADVARVLESRAYASDGRCVLRVQDDTRARGGTWHLEVSAQGASCTPTDQDPDLELSIEGLSSVWLGGVRATQLLDAGQIVETTGQAAAGLDRLLAVDRAPWTSFRF